MTRADRPSPEARNRFQLAHGAPLDRVVDKIQDHVDDWLAAFIRHAPFAVLATADDRGRCDASPRGGEPGFVRVVGRRQLVLPEVPGNRLFQSLGNLDRNPGLALVFFIPGVDETARVNGTGRVLSIAELAAEIEPAAIADLVARDDLVQVVLIQVEEAYYHCGRALRAARLWDGEQIAGHRARPPVVRRARRDGAP